MNQYGPGRVLYPRLDAGPAPFEDSLRVLEEPVHVYPYRSAEKILEEYNCLMRRISLALIFTLLPAAAQLKRIPGHFENDRIAIESKVYHTKEEVNKLLGADLAGAVAVVEIKITPRGGEALLVERESFTLFSNKDAQRAPAFYPSKIAGQGALVIGYDKAHNSSPGTQVGGDPTGPVIGGLPGTGGMPTRLPGRGGVVGSPTTAPVTETTVTESADKKENPLLKILKARELPTGKTLTPVSGLLYFALDGKHKLKDLELWYRGPAGKFTVPYKP
jgi:hypothetical protein